MQILRVDSGPSAKVVPASAAPAGAPRGDRRGQIVSETATAGSVDSATDSKLDQSAAADSKSAAPQSDLRATVEPLLRAAGLDVAAVAAQLRTPAAAPVFTPIVAAEPADDASAGSGDDSHSAGVADDSEFF